MLLLLAACTGPGATEGAIAEPVTDPTPPASDDTGTPYVPPESVLQFDGDPPTNLIIVSLDTTRRDFVGRFTGNGNTPNLDRILAQGVSLDDHRSCSSWTGPSMTCVTTGLSPFELGWWPWNNDPQVPGIDDDLPTLAGQLRFQKGYRTGLVTSNQVFDNWLNLDRGFDVVRRPSWQPATVVTAAGLAVAQELLDTPQPFYLHVHYIDPHGNYCPPEEYVDLEDYVDIGEDVCADMYNLARNDYGTAEPAWRDAFRTDLLELYDAEIEYWDVEFGLLWQGLEELGALDDTLVMFTTDHGEQILERGSLGHGITLGAEENRAVAGFWAKNLVPQAWAGPTIHQDLAATLHDHFSVVPSTPSSGEVVGLASADRTRRALLYWGPGTVRLSIVKGHQQLTYDWWGSAELFDLERDPTGLVDYYDPGDADAQALQVPMQAFIDEIHALWPSAGDPVPVW